MVLLRHVAITYYVVNGITTPYGISVIIVAQVVTLLQARAHRYRSIRMAGHWGHIIGYHGTT